MPKGRRAIVESRCRGGCHRAGREFLTEGLCPPLCHERWSSICPRARALRSGAALDCGETRAKCFDARCPDGGRAILRGEAVEDDGLPNIRKTARHGGPCRAVLFSHTRIHEKQDNRLVLIAPTARWILMRGSVKSYAQIRLQTLAE